MKRRISATEAAREFSDIINRVRYRGDEFIVERGGEPVCRISPVAPTHATLADLIEVLKKFPPDEEFADDLEDIIKNQPPIPKSPWER